jgi:Domain of unknown function (DUF4430)
MKKTRVVSAAAVVGIALGAGLWAFAQPSQEVKPTHSAANPPGQFQPGKPEACFLPRMRVVVDFGDGTQVHYTRVDMVDVKADEDGTWSALEVMETAEKQEGPRKLRFASRGRGTTAFLTAIGGVANEGGGDDKRSWQYWINDEYGKVGMGSARLKPGDRLTWAFLPYSATPPKRPD